MEFKDGFFMTNDGRQIPMTCCCSNDDRADNRTIDALKYAISTRESWTVSAKDAQIHLMKTQTYDPIDYVIYHNPATIVYWKDGTRTVVKCSENDDWDPEKGLAMAIVKKSLGNRGSFNTIMKKHLPEEAR